MSNNSKPAPTESGRDPLEQALVFRKKRFRLLGVLAAITVIAAPLYVGGGGDVDLPDAIMWVSFAVSVLQIRSIGFRLLNPEKVPDRLVAHASRKGRPLRLEQLGRQFAGIGAVMLLAPILFGFVFLVDTGELWRFLIFLPAAAVGGVVGWHRSERVLRRFYELGVS